MTPAELYVILPYSFIKIYDLAEVIKINIIVVPKLSVLRLEFHNFSYVT